MLCLELCGSITTFLSAVHLSQIYAYHLLGCIVRNDSHTGNHFQIIQYRKVHRVGHCHLDLGNTLKAERYYFMLSYKIITNRSNSLRISLLQVIIRCELVSLGNMHEFRKLSFGNESHRHDGLTQFHMSVFLFQKSALQLFLRQKSCLDQLVTKSFFLTKNSHFPLFLLKSSEQIGKHDELFRRHRLPPFPTLP